MVGRLTIVKYLWRKGINFRSYQGVVGGAMAVVLPCWTVKVKGLVLNFQWLGSLHGTL